MWSALIFGEVTVGVEQLAGGGVFGLLTIVLAQLMRRQKDTDERRDAITTLAFDREARAASERDEALDERDRAYGDLLAARVECADLRARLSAAEHQLRQRKGSPDADL